MARFFGSYLMIFLNKTIVKKIAITGGIASGKSTLLNNFATKFPVFNCDNAIKQIYQKEEILEKIKKTFAIENFSKPVLLKILLQRPENLKKLEAILYPELHKLMLEFERLARKKSHSGQIKLTFFEVPLLFEKNLSHKYDSIVVIKSNKIQRKKNFLKRSGKVEQSADVFNLFNNIQWSDAKRFSIVQNFQYRRKKTLLYFLPVTQKCDINFYRNVHTFKIKK